jgi:two-component system, sensor histidine kinase and response regulator
MPIIVVDDDAISRRLVGAVLRKHSFEVVELASGKEAIDFLQGHGPVKLVISDVVMPEVDGFDMLRFMKADQRFKKIPVILVTSLNDTESVMKGIELGAADYVTKPVMGAILIAKIERILSPDRVRVLVVDSEPAMRNAIIQIVERIGFAALDVGSAEEGLALLKSNKVSAVISDCKLGGMTGVELLKAVKQEHPGLPVLLMTGSHESFSARQLLMAGADGYIAKPFHNVEIVRKLRAITGQTA